VNLTGAAVFALVIASALVIIIIGSSQQISFRALARPRFLESTVYGAQVGRYKRLALSLAPLHRSPGTWKRCGELFRLFMKVYSPPAFLRLTVMASSRVAA
jgi:hypothetical protein